MTSSRFILLMLLAGCLTLPQAAFPAEAVEVNGASAVAYIRSCRKPNGAFGPADQDYTDAAWNYPAVHALRLLDSGISKPDQILANGLGYPKGHAGYGHWLVYHQAMTRWLLKGDRDVEASRSEAESKSVRLTHQGYEIRYYSSPFGTDGDHFFKTDGASTSQQFRESTELGFYNLSSLYYLVAAITADGRQIANPDQLVKFILDRQAPNGGFVDLRTPDGEPQDSETHIAHTFHAVASLRLLNQNSIPGAERCVRFAQACHVSKTEIEGIGTGGFRFAPDRTRAGNYADVYYTWAALQVLQLLGAEPADAAACRSWLLSLQNHDGGFGDRPGWRSRLYSTYYALHSLAILGERESLRKGGRHHTTNRSERFGSQSALETIAGTNLPNARRAIPARRVAVPPAQPETDPSFRIYQGLFKTPLVEPDDLPGLSRRGFNLLAMKTADFSAAAAVRKSAHSAEKPLAIVLCPEAYPHRLRRSGGALLHHVGNFSLDPLWSPSQREAWRTADSKGREGLRWPDYQKHVLKPLQQIGSLCYPEQDFEYEFALSSYDDGIYDRFGYNAIQVGFNWSPRDFVRVFPWRERYTDKLPPIADADSHGDLKKWSGQLDHTRHLYIAANGSYADFQTAARHGRVVCVVTGVEGVASGVSYYGRLEAVRFVRERVNEWKWWTDAGQVKSD